MVNIISIYGVNDTPALLPTNNKNKYTHTHTGVQQKRKNIRQQRYCTPVYFLVSKKSLLTCALLNKLCVLAYRVLRS